MIGIKVDHQERSVIEKGNFKDTEQSEQQNACMGR